MSSWPDPIAAINAAISSRKFDIKLQPDLKPIVHLGELPCLIFN